MTQMPVVRFLDRNTPPHIATLILIAGISALNMSIFLPSLARMTRYFGTDYATMQLALSGYLAATALLQIIIGPISDRYGRRPVVLWAMAVFVVASFGAYLAPSVGIFLAFRMLQAAVATGLVLSRAVVRDMVPQAQAASMIGYVTMGMALVPMVGPMIGGALDEMFGWHATFVLLTLTGAAVWLLCYLIWAKLWPRAACRFATSCAATPSCSPRRASGAMRSALHLLRGRFLRCLGGAAFIAGTVFGLSPFMSGVALGAPAIGYALGNFFAGRYSVRFGINKMAIIGTLTIIAGLGTSLVLALFGITHPLIFFGFAPFWGLATASPCPMSPRACCQCARILPARPLGLGGAMMVGGGAVLAQYASTLLDPTTGALPLQWLMFLTGIASLLSILFVIWREGRVT